MILGLRGGASHEGLREVLPRFCQLARDTGLRLRFGRELFERSGFNAGELGCAGQADILPEESLSDAVDIIVALGGDGSILGAARELKRDLPLLGVHMGSMGYLSAAVPEQLEQCLEDLVEGRLHEEARMMLRLRIPRGKRSLIMDALNDIVLTGEDPGHIIRLRTRIDGEELFKVAGDGLIHCTPTGTTAYNLGGGGPVLDPRMEAMVLTPIMPHSISVRPIVASATSRLESESLDNRRPLRVMVDGQVSVALNEGERLIVERSPRRLRLLRTAPPGFIGVLRRKLKWNVEDE